MEAARIRLCRKALKAEIVIARALQIGEEKRAEDAEG